MNSGKSIFSQLMDFIPKHEFDKCVKKYKGNYKSQTFTAWNHFLCMAFAQLTGRESLRDTEICLKVMQSRIYHMGFRGRICKSTIGYNNEHRDWRIFADLAQILIRKASVLYSDDDFGIQLSEPVYALDSTTIDLCLSMFPWAKFRTTKGAVKVHTLLNLRGNIPSFIQVTDGSVHDVNILDKLITEPGSFYVMDRGYLDFFRLYCMHQNQSYFVIRWKRNVKLQRVYSHPIDRATGLICDQTVKLTGSQTAVDYPDYLRRVKYRDPEEGRTFVFLTNNFSIPPLVVAEIYKNRWMVELFFKWIKQHLKIKIFFGTSENAVKLQIWVAVAVYVLVAIVKKELKIETNLYTILQILSVTVFEKISINEALTEMSYKKNSNENPNQLLLF